MISDLDALYRHRQYRLLCAWPHRPTRWRLAACSAAPLWLGLQPRSVERQRYLRPRAVKPLVWRDLVKRRHTFQSCRPEPPLWIAYRSACLISARIVSPHRQKRHRSAWQWCRRMNRPAAMPYRRHRWLRTMPCRGWRRRCGSVSTPFWLWPQLSLLIPAAYRWNQ